MFDTRRFGLKTPASLTLGILSGGLAALTILPTSIPLKYRVASAEQTLVASNAANTARLATSHIDRGSASLLSEWQLVHVTILNEDHSIRDVAGAPLPTGAIQATCQSTLGGLFYNTKNGPIAIGCATHSDGSLVVTATTPAITQGRQITLMVAILSIIVGLLTAFGVMSVLSPLTNIRDALIRVGEGERGVRLTTTGYRELDELVFQLNQAARAMELREDETEGRMRLIQEMARIVAHEVRNPLQTIELMTSLLEDEQSTDERQEIAEALHQEIRSLDKVVTTFLSQGSSITGLHLQRKHRSLSQIVEQAISIRTRAAKSDAIPLSITRLDETSSNIDTALVSRAVGNLIQQSMNVGIPHQSKILVSVTAKASAVITITVSPVHTPETVQDTLRTGTSLALGVFQAHSGTIHFDVVSQDLTITATLPLSQATS